MKQKLVSRALVSSKVRMRPREITSQGRQEPCSGRTAVTQILSCHARVKHGTSKVGNWFKSPKSNTVLGTHGSIYEQWPPSSAPVTKMTGSKRDLKKKLGDPANG